MQEKFYGWTTDLNLHTLCLMWSYVRIRGLKKHCDDLNISRWELQLDILLISCKLRRNLERHGQQQLAYLKGKYNTIHGTNQNMLFDLSVKFNILSWKVGHIKGACHKGWILQPKESSRQKLLVFSARCNFFALCTFINQKRNCFVSKKTRPGQVTWLNTPCETRHQTTACA